MNRFSIFLIFCISIILWVFLSGQRQRGIFTLDFEEGNLRGWTQKGTAFNNQPTYGDNPVARNRGQSSNHQGNYWIGTFEDFQNQRGQEPGNVQGDEPTGSLRSPNFIIPEGQLSFLIGGGGNMDETWVALMEVTGPGEFDQRELFRASGNNSETMERVFWPLEAHAGKTGYLRIVDNASGSWGHINVDDFQFIQPQPTREIQVPDLIGKHIEQVEEIFTEMEQKLRLGRVNEIESDLPAGTIIGQNPAPFSWVPENSFVHFTISRQRPEVGAVPELVIVPDLQNYTEAEARDILLKNDLTLGEIMEAAVVSDIEPGRIMDQSPPAGTRLQAGNPVSIVVAIPADIQSYQLHLYSNQTTMEPGHSVQLKADLRPPTDGVEYQFHFGNGQESAWSPSPLMEYRYSEEGIYQPYVEARMHQNRTIVSNSIDLLVQSPSPINWPVLAFVSLVILVGIVMGIRQIRRNKVKRLAKEKIRIEVHPNSVQQVISTTGAFSKINLQKELLMEKGVETLEFKNADEILGRVPDSIRLDKVLDLQKMRDSWLLKSDHLEAHAKFAGIKDRLSSQVHMLRWGVVMEEIFQKFRTCLDLDLMKIMLTAWLNYDIPEKYRKSKKIAEGEETFVNLAPHTIKSLYSPEVEVFLDKISLGTIRFQMHLFFTLHGFLLKVINHEISEIQSGQCIAEGDILCEGIKIYDIKSNIELPENLVIKKRLSVSKR